MSKRDFYEVLEVSRDSSEDDIRRAYRKLALKYHPDRNQDDPEAEAKFKEATEAYSVLSDKDKRQTYDQFGHQGLGGGGFDFSGAGMGDIFNQFQDLFSDFFGGGGGGFGGGQSSRRPSGGRSVRVEATIELADAMKGVKREITVEGAAACETCSGSGAEKGSRPEACVQCGGSGQMATQRGFIMFSTTCTRCNGNGTVISNPCGDCAGKGAVAKRRKVLVTFPAGIDSGQRLRVPGQGMPGPPGTPPGDLYVDVEVAEHENFERQAEDLITRQTVSFAQAVLGTELTIKLPDDTEAKVKVREGTQPGTVISHAGKGVPALGKRGGRGKLHTVITVDVPKKLSRKAKKLLEQLNDELGS